MCWLKKPGLSLKRVFVNILGWSKQLLPQSMGHMAIEASRVSGSCVSGIWRKCGFKRPTKSYYSQVNSVKSKLLL